MIDLRSLPYYLLSHQNGSRKVGSLRPIRDNDFEQEYKPMMRHRVVFVASIVATQLAICGVGATISRPTAPPDGYHIYSGNTHAHTKFTWSHGEQWESDKAKKGKSKDEEAAI